MIQNELPPVYVLNYDHFGIILWGMDSVRSVLAEQIERLEKYKDIAVGWDNEAFTYDCMAHHAPELLGRLKTAMRRFPGRLGIGASTYGQPLSRFISEEANVRQLTYALDCIERHFGIARKVYVMSEHAFHGQMPQLLKKAGFEGAILRTHFMMYGFTPTADEPVVNWIGPDGTSLPAVPMYHQQPEAVWDVASGPGPFGKVTMDGKILTDYDLKNSLEVFRHRYGRTIVPLVASRADDPRQREEILEAHSGDPAYKWLLADDLFQYLPVPATALKPKAEDYGARMPWGFCGNWIWNRSRQLEVQTLTAERLNAIAFALGAKDHSPTLEKAWKALMVAQHHDIQIMGLENAGRAFFYQVQRHTQAVIDRHLPALCSRIGHNNEPRQVAFNPLPWDRFCRLNTDNGPVCCTVPAMGFAVVPLQERQNTGQPHWNTDTKTLTTQNYLIELHPKGGFRRFRDRQGRDVFKSDAVSGVLSGVVNGCRVYSQVAQVDVKVSGDISKVIEDGYIASIPYHCEWTFYQDSPMIHWKGRLTVNGQKIGLPAADAQDSVSAFSHAEKIGLHLYPNLSRPWVGIEDHPFAVTTTANSCLQGNYWTAAADAQGGLALFNRGLMGTLLEEDGRISVPLAFSHYYIWNTVYMKGEYDYELMLLPFEGDWKRQDLHRKALEYNFPCLIYHVNTLHEPLGECWSPIAGLETDAVMSALFTVGRSIYARFYEHRGENTTAAMSWMGHPVSFEEVDLRLRPIGRLGSTLPLGPWQIRTVRLAEPLPARAYPYVHSRQYERRKHGDWHNSEWFKAESGGAIDNPEWKIE